MVDQITGGCEMMKFAVNHPYKFNSPTLAFLTGALQFISILSIEVASIGVICAAIDTIDMIFNFIALAILADFGVYVFSSMKNESFQEMIEEEFCKDVLVIKHTTSKKCLADELCESERDEEGEFRALKKTFESRTCGNKVMYLIYKVMRSIYLSCIYYFLPMAAVVISGYIPIKNRALF